VEDRRLPHREHMFAQTETTKVARAFALASGARDSLHSLSP
jgi:hypothetical protein